MLYTEYKGKKMDSKISELLDEKISDMNKQSRNHLKAAVVSPAIIALRNMEYPSLEQTNKDSLENPNSQSESN